jgi:DDE_Tnp_1-associated
MYPSWLNQEVDVMENELDDESCDEFIHSLERHFGALPDYRRQESISHRLVDILFIALCAIICGANTLKAVAIYAFHKRDWLTDILETTEVPSYTTFWTVFALLDPVVLEECFVSWVKSKFTLKNEDVVSIDGKAQRGTAKKGSPNSFVHIAGRMGS